MRFISYPASSLYTTLFFAVNQVFAQSTIDVSIVVFVIPIVFAKATGLQTIGLANHRWFTDLFSHALLLFAPFAGHPSSSPFLGAFSTFSPPRKVLCSVEQRAQRTAWRGAVSGWTSPRSLGTKCIPEICVKKGQFRNALVIKMITCNIFCLGNCSSEDYNYNYFFIPS